MATLALIICRNDITEIPKIHTRLLAGRPLISYVIDQARTIPEIETVIVFADNFETRDVAENYGVRAFCAEIATESIEEIMTVALAKFEGKNADIYDDILILKSGVPFLTEKSIHKLLEMLKTKSTNGAIFCRKRGSRDIDNILAAAVKRKSIRNIFSGDDRIVSLQLSEHEGIEICDRNTWILGESLLKKKKILFRADGYTELGLGHIYNCITLAYAMVEHEVLIVLQKESAEGLEKVRESGLPYRIIDKEADVFQVIKDYAPDVFVYDKLNSDKEFIRSLKELVPRVVTIEDLGDGTRHADAVINALYTEEELSGRNVYSGWRYVCLREEFQVEKPRRFSEEVCNVMIMFGGTDPSNYNRMLYDVIREFSSNYSAIQFHFVVGIGYDVKKNKLFSVEEKNIFVHPNVQRVTRFMRKADLAITSQGRSIFEFAAMGVPAIVLSQNSREKMHSFAEMDHGFINLGTSDEMDAKMIESTLEWLINAKNVRKNMYELMQKYPLREGLERVKRIILGEVL